MDDILVRPFHRNETHNFATLGSGAFGEKASGLISIYDHLYREFPEGTYEGIDIYIPESLIILTDQFERFMEENYLWDIVTHDLTDAQVTQIFQKASLPALLAGDLFEFAQKVTYPLAVRSSSLLEDAMKEPFAGIYHTKMLPNWYLDPQLRFQKLVQAVKLIWSSIYCKASRDYFKAIQKDFLSERMAVLIQEVVGNRHEDRYYPVISGVARSYNYYAYQENQPSDGVINLALGLGKMIVDGGNVWQYNPQRPAHPLPFSESDLLRFTQNAFYAIHMGENVNYDAAHPDEFLTLHTLKDADHDKTLSLCAYLGDRDTHTPKIIDFAPILRYDLYPLNALLKRLLTLCEEVFQVKVEIEFALAQKPEGGLRFGFLQVRPMMVSHETVTLSPTEPDSVFLHSDNVLGNGKCNDLTDFVFVKRNAFDPALTRDMVMELEQMNAHFIAEDKQYVLLVYGRLGSSDPWLGIPVQWCQINKVAVIIESSLPGFYPDLSQGSHFFHNLLSFEVKYFSLGKSEQHNLDYEWLLQQPIVHDGRFIRHIRLPGPMLIEVDGRSRRGVIHKTRR